MERKNKYMNSHHKIYNKNYLKIFVFKQIIIMLYLNIIKPFPNLRNKFFLFSELNQILLKVKGSGMVNIFNPDFNFKPSSYYLNNDTNPKAINNASIELVDSENEVKLIFTNIVTSCKSMFRGCTNIIEIDLSNFISSNIENIDYMFYGCTSLKNIIFGKFETSKLNIMEYVFQQCSSLETLNLSSFDTSKVTDFHYMFAGCNSLKYLDLSNFNTSSCICTIFMFSDCISITSLNLSSFDTSKVTLMFNMFYNCKNLISLDLSSFDTNSVIQMQKMFYGCEKSEFVNFKIATISTINLI